MTENCRKFIAFTGKELDAETGYGYFGARYMDHELLTMWLSVDPLADKYPGISPYAYCAWNPVKLVDPDGREMDDYKFNSTTGGLTLVKKTNDDFDIIEYDDGSIQTIDKGILNGKNEGEDISVKGFSVTDSKLMPEAIRLTVQLSRKCHKEIAFSGHGSQMQDVKCVSVLPWDQSTCDHFSGIVKLKDLLFIAHTHPGCVGDDTKGHGAPSSTDYKLLDKFPGVAEFIISNDGLSNFKLKENDPKPTIPRLLNCWLTGHSYNSYSKDRFDEK